MPLTPEVWLNEFTVNTVTAGNQFDSDVIQLANGNVLVTWTSDADTGAGSFPGLDVIGQIFDPLGNPVGAEFQVNSFNAGDEQGMDSAALPGGGFVSVYEETNAGVTSIRLAERSDTGGFVSSNTTVVSDSSTATPNYSNPVVAVSSATSVLVVYEEVLPAGEVDVVGKIYNPATDTYGPQLTVFDAGSGAAEVADVTVLDNGNYVITAHDDGTDSSVVFRILDSSGVDLTGNTSVANTSSNGDIDQNASVTALTGGGFVVVWENTDTNGTNLEFQRYNSAGVAQGGVVTVDSSGATDDNNEAVVIPLNDGGFAVIYDDDEADNLSVQRYDSDGATVGSTFVISGPASGPSATLLEDGRMAVTWNDTASGDVGMEILDIRDNANFPSVYTTNQVIGTTGTDYINVETVDDQVHGWEGNDFMFFELASELNAGDTYDGGTGFDTLVFLRRGNTYELGPATIASIEAIEFSGIGGTGTQTVRLNANQVGGSTISSTALISSLGGEEDVLEVTMGTATDVSLAGFTFQDWDVGTDAIHINGDGDNETITGSIQADTINAGGGNDQIDGGIGGGNTLIGGTGDDTYFTDSYGDTIVEAAGEGNDTVVSSFNFFLNAGAEVERIETNDANGTTDIVLVGNEFAQVIVGNDGANTLSGLGGIDSTYGGGGNDFHVVDNAADLVFEAIGEGTVDGVYTTVDYALQAGSEIERFVATPFASTNDIALTGNEFGQVMVGNQGNNTINGEGGVDSLYGFGGDDILESGSGNDNLFGGTGFDTFLFSETQGTAGGIDRIYDLTAADDIRIDSVAQSGLIALTASQFQIGTAANDADDRVIYDDTSGVFWFDADGNGAGVAILFGVINGAPSGIDHTYFELV